MTFEPTAEQFGPFWKYIADPEVTDIDYNGSQLWVTDFGRGRYRAEEFLTKEFFPSARERFVNELEKERILGLTENREEKSKKKYCRSCRKLV